MIVKDEEWCKLSSYRCWKIFCDVGVLKFLKTEPDPYVALVFHPLEAESEGHHYKLMVTSDIGSWKALDFAMFTLDWKCHLTMM